MNQDLDRLLELSKKTGDKLIVYDKQDGNHFVLMGVDEYEYLADSQYQDMRGDVRGLSEEELIDKLNRDITAWRANKNLEEDFSEGDFDLDSDGVDMDDWHSISEVLGGAKQGLGGLAEEIGDIPDIKVMEDRLAVETDSNLSVQESAERDNNLSVHEAVEIDSNLSVEELEELKEPQYDPVFEESLDAPPIGGNVPFVEQQVEQTKVEDLDDEEPVFLEEPIE